jgi:hypothetical protein
MDQEHLGQIAQLLLIVQSPKTTGNTMSVGTWTRLTTGLECSSSRGKQFRHQYRWQPCTVWPSRFVENAVLTGGAKVAERLS